MGLCRRQRTFAHDCIVKLLFDQNISFRVVKALDVILPCAQVRALGLENARDVDIWKYALEHGYSIVTFDADFSDLVTLKGHPPKVIWLRTGNMSTSVLIEVFKKHAPLISLFHYST